MTYIGLFISFFKTKPRIRLGSNLLPTVTIKPTDSGRQNKKCNKNNLHHSLCTKHARHWCQKYGATARKEKSLEIRLQPSNLIEQNKSLYHQIVRIVNSTTIK